MDLDWHLEVHLSQSRRKHSASSELNAKKPPQLVEREAFPHSGSHATTS
jgi:hypothetical protein